MISRPLFFLAGAGLGVYAVLKARRIAESLTVDGLRDRASALGLGARLFVEEVAAGQVEKEAELRERLGLDLPRHAALTSSSVPSGSAASIEDSTPTQQETQR